MGARFFSSFGTHLTLLTITSEREARRWAREEFVDHSICRPGTHWNGELYGYYSTDEEVEECNMNGDLERMMDDMWD